MEDICPMACKIFSIFILFPEQRSKTAVPETLSMDQHRVRKL